MSLASRLNLEEMYGLCPGTGTKKTVCIKRVSVMRGLVGVGEGSESFFFFDDMVKIFDSSLHRIFESENFRFSFFYEKYKNSLSWGFKCERGTSLARRAMCE